MTLYLRNSIFHLQMADFKELRSKYNQEIRNLEEQEKEIQKQINKIKEEYREALKAYVQADENRIVWVVTRVPNDQRHIAHTVAMSLSKEGVSRYKNGESAGRSDDVEWYYTVTKVTIDSISEYQLEKIQD